MKPKRIAELEAFASKTVGDGKGPDLFFVTDQGVVVTITRELSLAHRHWKELALRSPRVESALENRNYGVICDVSPIAEEPGAKLVIHDGAREFARQHKQRLPDSLS